MKKKYLFFSGILILFLGASFILSKCSNGNTAFVTISFNSSRHSASMRQSDFLDKLRNLFLPEAYAKGSAWSPAHTSVKITVSGPKMNEIEAQVAPYAESLTMEIPAGEQRQFTVIAYDKTERNTGGHTIIDLKAGEEKSIAIKMLPIPTALTYYGTGMMYWDHPDAVSGLTLIKYIIYESNTIDGTYVKKSETTYQEFTSGTVNKYYKVSAYFQTYGEGELSDAYRMQ